MNHRLGQYRFITCHNCEHFNGWGCQHLTTDNRLDTEEVRYRAWSKFINDPKSVCPNDPDIWKTRLRERVQSRIPVSEDIAKERFDICKQCEYARESASKCTHYIGCCFGRWRTMLNSQCPLGKWPEIIEERIHDYGR